MSDTTTPPAPAETEAPAPAPQQELPLATEAPAPEPTEEQQQQAAREKEDRRIAQLRARLGAAERERDRQAAELQAYRTQIQQLAPREETPEQRQARRDAEIYAKAAADIEAKRFHAEGEAQFPDWKQKCDDLVAMGADSGFAQLLVEMPEGVRIAAALAADPTEVQRIANLRSERARAVALGKYAATLSEPRAAIPERPAATRAPPPIRPVQGRASPVEDEYTMTPQQLVDRYMRQNIDRQRR